MSEVTVTSLANFRNEVSYGDRHVLITDEPVVTGGEDAYRAADRLATGHACASERGHPGRKRAQHAQTVRASRSCGQGCPRSYHTPLQII